MEYAILGIHDKKVDTIEGNVARVRLFINGEKTDEDFPLPELMPGVVPSAEVYGMVLKPAILKRIAELKGQPHE